MWGYPIFTTHTTMGIFTRKTISFLKLHKRILNNTYIIDSPHNRGDIKTLAWKEDFMKSATKYGTLPSATPQFHPVGHIGRLELLNGGGVCSAIVGIYKNIVRVKGKLYCDMSAPEQAEVDDMKVAIAISGRGPSFSVVTGPQLARASGAL